MTESTSGTQTLIIERDLPHPPTKVWRALTQRALIAEWLMANDFELKMGRAFQLRTEPVGGWSGIIDCEVVAIDEPRLLSYRWESMGLKTVVAFTLTATAAGTHLRMEQSGFASQDDQNYRGATYGWQKFLAQLEQVLETA
jgi:uncharacterized protein YndB with AHSA1/START domain